MSQAAMPSSTDLVSFLEAAGVGTALATGDVDEFLASAVREWELRTGWRPFLASTSSSYYFDPADDGVRLDLGCGFATLTAVVVGVTFSDPTGTTLTVNEDYFLEPYLDAGDGETPYTGVRFVRAYYGSPRSVKITGRKGYCTAVPDDAWQAVLWRAAAAACPTIRQTGTPERVTEGAVTLQYGSGGSQESIWNHAFEAAVSRYKRILV